MTYNLFLIVIGGIIYWRRGLVHTKAVVWTAVGGVPTVLVGAYLTAEVPGRIFMALTGLFSGLLANGGGFLLLPAYLLLFCFSPQKAAATSLVAVSLLALPGTLAHYILGHIDFKIVALMAVGVIPSNLRRGTPRTFFKQRQSALVFWAVLAPIWAVLPFTYALPRRSVRVVQLNDEDINIEEENENNNRNQKRGYILNAFRVHPNPGYAINGRK